MKCLNTKGAWRLESKSKGLLACYLWGVSSRLITEWSFNLYWKDHDFPLSRSHEISSPLANIIISTNEYVKLSIDKSCLHHRVRIHVVFVNRAESPATRRSYSSIRPIIIPIVFVPFDWIPLYPHSQLRLKGIRMNHRIRKCWWPCGFRCCGCWGSDEKACFRLIETYHSRNSAMRLVHIWRIVCCRNYQVVALLSIQRVDHVLMMCR